MMETTKSSILVVTEPAPTNCAKDGTVFSPANEMTEVTKAAHTGRPITISASFISCKGRAFQASASSFGRHHDFPKTPNVIA
jgi:hypothetical protein